MYNIKEWFNWVHDYQLYIKNITFKSRYRCKFGTRCHSSYCIHIHPYDIGYYKSEFCRSYYLCRYETSVTSCKKKCVQEDGSYCPFRHCVHNNKTVLTCTSIQCKGHCTKCL